jgi:hypothetical protein
MKRKCENCGKEFSHIWSTEYSEHLTVEQLLDRSANKFCSKTCQYESQKKVLDKFFDGSFPENALTCKPIIITYCAQKRLKDWQIEVNNFFKTINKNAVIFKDYEYFTIDITQKGNE